MTPRVSIVIPSYNSVEFINATMESVLAQTFADFELLVSDHSSTDGTWEALQRFLNDPRVRLSRLSSGGGAPANFQAVTDMATGELIKLVCGDDLLYPDNLVKQVAAMDAHPSAVLVASPRDVVDAAGAPIFRNRGLAGLRGEVHGRAAIRRTVRAGTNIFGEPASVLFKRAALIQAGGWDAHLPYLIDEATYCRVLLHGNLIALATTLAAFRVSESQWSVQLVKEQAQQAITFGQEIASAHPGLLTSWDLLAGRLHARANTIVRRGVYRWLGRRMHTNVATDCT